MERIVEGLNEATKDCGNVKIALETMAGKGSECGRTFDELQYIIENVDNNECLGVCMDTCHLHDAGFDLTKFDDILTEFGIGDTISFTSQLLHGHLDVKLIVLLLSLYNVLFLALKS